MKTCPSYLWVTQVTEPKDLDEPTCLRASCAIQKRRIQTRLLFSRERNTVEKEIQPVLYPLDWMGQVPNQNITRILRVHPDKMSTNRGNRNMQTMSSSALALHLRPRHPSVQPPSGIHRRMVDTATYLIITKHYVSFDIWTMRHRTFPMNQSDPQTGFTPLILIRCLCSHPTDNSHLLLYLPWGSQMSLRFMVSLPIRHRAEIAVQRDDGVAHGKKQTKMVSKSYNTSHMRPGLKTTPFWYISVKNELGRWNSMNRWRAQY